MPAGSPNKQTIASQKYHEKVGIIAKSYKLKKEVVEQFKEACESAGESQASVLTRYMQQYIEEHKN